jgi:hypothetical protein
MPIDSPRHVRRRHSPPPTSPRRSGVLDMELIVLSGMGVIALLAIKIFEYCR